LNYVFNHWLNYVSQWALDANGGNNFDLLESSPKIFQPITKEEAAVHGDEIAVDKSLNPRETSKQGLLKLLIELIPLPYYEACRIMQDRMRGSC
jgi:hypothetical protein